MALKGLGDLPKEEADKLKDFIMLVSILGEQMDISPGNFLGSLVLLSKHTVEIIVKAYNNDEIEDMPVKEWNQSMDKMIAIAKSGKL